MKPQPKKPASKASKAHEARVLCPFLPLCGTSCLCFCLSRDFQRKAKVDKKKKKKPEDRSETDYAKVGY